MSTVFCDCCTALSCTVPVNSRVFLYILFGFATKSKKKIKSVKSYSFTNMRNFQNLLLLFVHEVITSHFADNSWPSVTSGNGIGAVLVVSVNCIFTIVCDWRTGVPQPRVTYDVEAGHMLEWRCALKQNWTQTIHIPVRNVAKDKALTAAARMVRYVTCFVTSDWRRLL